MNFPTRNPFGDAALQSANVLKLAEIGRDGMSFAALSFNDLLSLGQWLAPPSHQKHLGTGRGINLRDAPSDAVACPGHNRQPPIESERRQLRRCALAGHGRLGAGNLTASAR